MPTTEQQPTSVGGSSGPVRGAGEFLVEDVAATTRAEESDAFESVQLLHVALLRLQTHVTHALVGARDEPLHLL